MTTTYRYPIIGEHDMALTNLVAPEHYINPKPKALYDAAVIGAGTAGLIAAGAVAGLGGKVALIEKNAMGGDCLNVGCVPSKGIIRAGRAVMAVRNSAEFGMENPEMLKHNFSVAMERMRALRAKIARADSVERYLRKGVDVFLGHGSFVNSHELMAGDIRLRFKKAIIATGARAAELPIPGLKESGHLTNETLFSLTELPKRFVVIGAGPIGCEMAQTFARFGSSVTVIDRGEMILSKEDRDVGSIVKSAMEKDGVNFIFNAVIDKVDKNEKGRQLLITVNGSKQIVEADEILVGVGRAPNVENLGLESAGVAFDKSEIVVNDLLQTSVSHIYASGDVCSRFQFTHAADAMSRMVIQNAFFFGRKKASDLVIPWCTYTDPELAHVGINLKEAEKDPAIRTINIPFEFLDRAMLDGATEGMLRVHYGKKGKILGGTLVAGHAGEMIGELALAITKGMSLSDLSATIHPYPTQSEVFRRAGDEYRKTLLTPVIFKLLKTILTMRK